MKKYICHALIVLALSAPALAQEMPAPRRMPRTPVDREATTQQHKTAIPASREIQGQALIIDTEKLRMGEFDLRLFGIVPPQLSASFGPQARAALDQLTTAQTVTCTIRDRDREGRFLATCRNANNSDLALELLKRGLAVAARGSIGSTDLGAVYIAAEQAAETQKTGLWSVVPPAAAVVPKTAPVAATPTPAPSTIATLAPANSSALTLPEAKPQGTEEKPIENAVRPKTIEVSVKPLVTPETLKAVAPEEDKLSAPEEPSFIMRYQLLVTGLVMLATALGMLAAIAIQRIIDRRTEMKAIAAALRGELMAARAVCFGRLKTSADIEDQDIAWPRIRSTLYQAYVGRLGWLGAELARRVASIYGQASDYASYYDSLTDDNSSGTVPKRQALQAVINRIDDVLPRLAIIEQTGSASASEAAALPKPAASSEPVMPPIPAPQSARVEIRPSAAATIIPPVVRLWSKVRDVAWGKKIPSAPDPIAEYTALIEEEMKRFTFDEGESDQEAGDASVTKLHG